MDVLDFRSPCILGLFLSFLFLLLSTVAFVVAFITIFCKDVITDVAVAVVTFFALVVLLVLLVLLVPEASKRDFFWGECGGDGGGLEDMMTFFYYNRVVCMFFLLDRYRASFLLPLVLFLLLLDPTTSMQYCTSFAQILTVD